MFWGAVENLEELFNLCFLRLSSQSGGLGGVHWYNILLPFMTAAENHFGDCAMTFQQDGATSRTSKETQTWCADHLPRFWTKNISPHLPLTCTLWTFSYGPLWRVNPVLLSTLQSICWRHLFLRCGKECAKKLYVPRSIPSQKRLRPVLKAKGRHFDWTCHALISLMVSI